MRKANFIQINIPNPCAEDWEQMTPKEQGRFCAQCRKCVIDFTGYSDAALYQFFSKNTVHVCGRFLNTQLNRDIHIPLQPHSRLYKLFIGLGLTLLFTQVPSAYARPLPPIVVENAFNAPDDDGKTIDSMGIQGQILNGKNEPIADAIVQVYQNNKVKSGAVTDVDGYYYVPLQVPGVYDIRVTCQHYRPDTTQKITVAEHAIVKLNFNLERDIRIMNEVYTTAGAVPLMNPYTGFDRKTIKPFQPVKGNKKKKRQ